MTRIARWWRGLPSQAKTGFIFGVLIAALTTLVFPGVPWLARQLLGGPSADLEVKAVALQDGRRSSYVQPDGTDIRRSQPRLEITVRNEGTSGAVITAAEFKVLAFAHLPTCASAGFLEVSQRYDVLLPPRPAIDQVLEKRVSQEIAKDESDLFGFTFQLPDRYVEKLGESGRDVFLLAVALEYNGDQRLDVGNMIVAVPDTPEDSFFDTSRDQELEKFFGPKAAACNAANRRKLRELLAHDGKRAEGLEALTATGG